MKKKMCFIVFGTVITAIILSVTVWAGVEKIGLFDKPAKMNEVKVEDDVDLENNISEPETKVNGSKVDYTISAEDQTVKAEIAKHNTDTADFYHNRKEKIVNKAFDLTFEKVGYIGGDEKEKITYKDKDGNEFVYDLKTGTLFFAQISSLKTEKGADSIDATAAKRIALSYANSVDMADDYKESYFKENERGYAVIFSKYISGYRTAESIETTVGFNGEIIGVRNNISIFEGKKISINKDSIQKKIDAELQKFESGTSEDMWIDVYNGEIVMNCKIKYKEDGSYHSTVAVIPLS